MALTINHPTLKEQTVYAYVADSSSTASGYTSARFRGKIVKLGVVAGAVVDSDRVITAKINGTSITGGAITLTASGSAVGQVTTAVPTALNNVVEDDTIEFATDGAGSTACPTQYFAVIRAS